MSDWLSLCWSTSAAVAVPSAPPIACQNWTLVALGFFGGLLLEVPTGVSCAATVEPGGAPPPPVPVVAAPGVPGGFDAGWPSRPPPPPTPHPPARGLTGGLSPHPPPPGSPPADPPPGPPAGLTRRRNPIDCRSRLFNLRTFNP